MSVRTCPHEDHMQEPLLYLSVNHARVPTSFSSPRRETERERDRELGREEERQEREGRVIFQDLLSPSLRWHANRHQPPGERVREEREGRLTRFRGLWSIKGLHRNSKTTPTISTSVVTACVAVGSKCVWLMCMVVWPWLCVQGCMKSVMTHLWRHLSRNLRILRAAWFCFFVRRLL